MTALVLAWLFGLVLQAPQAPAQNPPEPHPASIRGRVLRADGRPLALALVRLIPQRRGRPLGATTDADGSFAFDEIEPGEYRLTANKAGYVTMQLGQIPANAGGGAVLDLKSGDVRERVDITLPRVGAITGRIVDENGDPVEGALVRVEQVRYSGGRYELAEPFGARARLTDDRGHYRVWGLPPGKYVVAAQVGQVDYPGPGMVNLPGYAMTFYPGTASPADAAPVTVGLSQDIDAIDFAIAPVRTATISGTMVGADGEPLRGGIVLRPSVRSGGAAAVTGARIDADGHFAFRNVPPGEYVIASQAGRSTSYEEGEFTSQFVTVNGADVSGLVVQRSRGSAVTGRIVLEGGDAAPGAFTIQPRPIDPDRSPADGGIAELRIDADFTFRVDGVSGPRRFRLTDAPPGWALKSVRINGDDVTDTGFDVPADGRSVSGVEIVLTRNAGELAGTVTDIRGVAPEAAAVIVFPTDRQQWGPDSRFLLRVSVRPDGTYRARGLPDGEYYVAVSGPSGGEAWQDPAFLETLIPTARRVRVVEGQSASADFRVGQPR